MNALGQTPYTVRALTDRCLNTSHLQRQVEDSRPDGNGMRKITISLFDSEVSAIDEEDLSTLSAHVNACLNLGESGSCSIVKVEQKQKLVILFPSEYENDPIPVPSICRFNLPSYLRQLQANQIFVTSLGLVTPPLFANRTKASFQLRITSIGRFARECLSKCRDSMEKARARGHYSFAFPSTEFTKIITPDPSLREKYDGPNPHPYVYQPSAYFPIFATAIKNSFKAHNAEVKEIETEINVTVVWLKK